MYSKLSYLTYNHLQVFVRASWGKIESRFRHGWRLVLSSHYLSSIFFATRHRHPSAMSIRYVTLSISSKTWCKLNLPVALLNAIHEGTKGTGYSKWNSTILKSPHYLFTLKYFTLLLTYLGMKKLHEEIIHPSRRTHEAIGR